MDRFLKVQRWIEGADCVLIAAGAGMSAAAGIDYGDTARFAELFPAFVRKGFSARYELIGRMDLPEDAFWAYWALHVADIRFGQRNDRPYRELEALTRDKDRFVFTSNVDMLFPRNGFDTQRLYTPQGDYGLIQCAQACQETTWPSEPVLRRVLLSVDRQTQTVTDLTALPRCPNCGGRVFLNVRLNRYFVEQPYVQQREHLERWLNERRGSNLLVLEIGAGFNTPGVIRWPCEQIVAGWPNAHMVRVNPVHGEYRWSLGARSLSLSVDAAEAISVLSALHTSSL